MLCFQLWKHRSDLFSDGAFVAPCKGRLKDASAYLGPNRGIRLFLILCHLTYFDVRVFEEIDKSLMLFVYLVGLCETFHNC